MRKHIKKILIAGVLLIAFIFYVANYSYPAALRTAGITWIPSSPRIEVFSEFNNDRIVVAHSAEGTNFAHVASNRMVWRPVAGVSEEHRNPETGLLSMSWGYTIESNLYFAARRECPPYQDSRETTWTWQNWAGVNQEATFNDYTTIFWNFVFADNRLYHGRNAITLITIPPEKLPPGVAVRVRQNLNEYIIHLISYSCSTLPVRNPLDDVNVFELIYEFIEN